MSSEETRYGVIEKLTAGNYHYWKFDMRMHLCGMDLWEIVEGNEVADGDANEEERISRNARIKLILLFVWVSARN